VLGLH